MCNGKFNRFDKGFVVCVYEFPGLSGPFDPGDGDVRVKSPGLAGVVLKDISDPSENSTFSGRLPYAYPKNGAIASAERAGVIHRKHKGRSNLSGSGNDIRDPFESLIVGIAEKLHRYMKLLRRFPFDGRIGKGLLHKGNVIGSGPPYIFADIDGNKYSFDRHFDWLLARC